MNILHLLSCRDINPSGTKGFSTHTKHQEGGGGGRKGPTPVSQEREMLQT